MFNNQSKSKRSINFASSL